jgi:TRAP-type C4-dicarboxylate transport system substrate-binding protein
MKHLTSYLTVGAVAGTMLCAAPVAAESYRATIVAGLPATLLLIAQMPEAFVPSVVSRMQALGHTFEFDEQYGGAVAGNGQEMATIASGLAELGFCNSIVGANTLELQNMSYHTPFVSGDVALVTRVMNSLQFEDERMAAAWERNGVVYLGAPAGIDDYVLLTTFPVNSLADLAGRKIAAPGAAVNWLSGTGAVGVSSALNAYYNDLRAGVYEGALASPSLIWPMRLHEVAQNITVVGLGANFAGGICANRDWFLGLPEDVQQVLRDAAADAQVWHTERISAAFAGNLEKLVGAGVNVVTASDEFRRQWAAGMEPVARNWAKTLDGQGLAASAMLEVYMNRMREAGAVPVRDWDKE